MIKYPQAWVQIEDFLPDLRLRVAKAIAQNSESAYQAALDLSVLVHEGINEVRAVGRQQLHGDPP